MDIRREFDKHPPMEPLTSLAAMVRDWKRRTAPGGGLDVKRDAVVEFCREAPSYRVAVYRAVASRDRNGKMHNHQSKVRESARNLLGDRIIEEIVTAEDFDMLHDFIDELKPWGIGPVTVYDVSVRIGAFLGLEPQSLYLHAGVLAGWEALMGPLASRAQFGRVRRMDWPMALIGMKADDVEDFLCTYRSLFGGLR